MQYPLLFAILIAISPGFAAAAIDVEKDLLDPLREKASKEQIVVQILQRASVPTATHTALEIEFVGGKMLMNFAYDSEAVRRPGLLLRDIVLLDFWRTKGGSELKGL